MDPADRLQELLDRQDILDCIYRYCRGVDRLDRELMVSAYHPDAIDDHGVHRAPIDEFADWAFELHRRVHHAHQHYVMNHTCDLDGDVAHTETYYIMMGRNVSGTPVTLHGDRYLDRMERRNGRWAIAHRVSMLEWVGGVNEPELAPVDRIVSYVVARDRTDTSYDRPLMTQGVAIERGSILGTRVQRTALLAQNPAPTDREVREALEGNICRCTGYHNIVRAVRAAALAASEPA